MGLGEVRGSWREERRSRTRAASGEGSWRRSGRSCQRDGQQQRRQPVRSADARVESQSRARRTGRAGSSKEGAAASGRWEAADERARPGVSRELALVGPVPTDRPPPQRRSPPPPRPQPLCLPPPPRMSADTKEGENPPQLKGEAPVEVAVLAVQDHDSDADADEIVPSPLRTSARAGWGSSGLMKSARSSIEVRALAACSPFRPLARKASFEHGSERALTLLAPSSRFPGASQQPRTWDDPEDRSPPASLAGASRSYHTSQWRNNTPINAVHVVDLNEPPPSAEALAAKAVPVAEELDASGERAHVYFASKHERVKAVLGIVGKDDLAEGEKRERVRIVCKSDDWTAAATIVRRERAASLLPATRPPAPGSRTDKVVHLVSSSSAGPALPHRPAVHPNGHLAAPAGIPRPPALVPGRRAPVDDVRRRLPVGGRRRSLHARREARRLRRRRRWLVGRAGQGRGRGSRRLLGPLWVGPRARALRRRAGGARPARRGCQGGGKGGEEGLAKGVILVEERRRENLMGENVHARRARRLREVRVLKKRSLTLLAPKSTRRLALRLPHSPPPRRPAELQSLGGSAGVARRPPVPTPPSVPSARRPFDPAPPSVMRAQAA